MIPKKIHYCWIGGNPLTPLAKKCIASWKTFCPDYEIICWNESNYDFTKHPYMKQALEAKKWGFVPDYARLDIIYQYGGIYLDTDVEIIRSWDELLNEEAFCGHESDSTIALGLGFGSVAGNPMILEMRNEYDKISFVKADGTFNLTPSPYYQTHFFLQRNIILNNSIQKIQGMVIYPKEYFCPVDPQTRKIKLTTQTFSIHHYASSWFPKHLLLIRKTRKILETFLPYSVIRLLTQIKRLFFPADHY